MNESLGQAILSILIDLKGADKSLNELRNFFSQINTFTQRVNQGLGSVQDSISNLGRNAQNANSISGVFRNVERTVASATSNINGLTRALVNFERPLSRIGRNGVDAFESLNREIAAGASRGRELVDLASDVARSQAVDQNLQGIRDLDDLVARGERAREQEARNFEAARRGADQLAASYNRLMQAEERRLQQQDAQFEATLNQNTADERRIRNQRTLADISQQVGAPVSDLDSLINARSSQAAAANRSLNQRILSGLSRQVGGAVTDLTSMVNQRILSEVSRQVGAPVTDLDSLIDARLRQAAEAARRRNATTRQGIQGLFPQRQFQQNLRQQVNAMQQAGQRVGLSQQFINRRIQQTIRSQTALNMVTQVYNSAAYQQSQILRDVGFQLSDVGRNLTLISGAILAGLGFFAVKAAEFEQNVQNVIAVLGDLENTAQQELGFKVLSDRFISLAEITEFTANEIATASRQLGLAGFSLADINTSIEDVVNLASAGNVELEKAAKISANIGKAFNIDTSNFSRISDVLATVATNSNTTVETLGESFKLLAPISSNLGQSLEEVSSALGVLGSSGISASRSGTGLCHDDQTEVLTNKGWVFWRDLDYEDVDLDLEFASLNTEKDIIEYQKPTKMYKFDHDGEMYSVVNRHVDFMVTPDHRMYVSQGRVKHQKYEFVKAKDLGNEFRLIHAANGTVRDIEYFTLPEISINMGKYDRVDPPIEIEMDTWLKFLGAYLAEGWCRANAKKGPYTINLCQPTEVKGFLPFYQLLMEDDKLPFNFNYDTKNIRFCGSNKQLWTELLKYGHRSINKSIPDYVFNCSKRQIRLFLEYYRLGDGDAKRGNGTSFRIFTSSKKMSEGLCTLGVLAGYRTKVSSKEPDGEGGIIDGRKIKAKHTRYVVSFSETNDTLIQKKTINRTLKANTKGRDSRVDTFMGFTQYTGKVYCAEVPNSTLVTRRNGKIFISGNSRAFSELLEKSEDFDKVLKSLGSSFERIDPTKVGLTEIIAEFERLQKLSGFTTKNFFDLFDQRSARVITTLVNQGADALESLTEKAENSARAAERIRDTRLRTTEGQFRITLSALQSTVIELGNELLPLARDLLDLVAGITRGITSFLKGNDFAKLAAGLAGAATALGTFGLALSGVGAGLRALGVNALLNSLRTLVPQLLGTAAAANTLAASAGGAAASTTALGTALTFLTGPVGIAVGIAAIATAFFVYISSADDATDSIIKHQEAVESLVEKNTELVGSVRDLKNQFDLLRDLPNLNELELNRLINADTPLTRQNIAAQGEEIIKQIQGIRDKTNQLATDPTWAGFFANKARAATAGAFGIAAEVNDIGIEIDSLTGKIYTLRETTDINWLNLFRDGDFVTTTVNKVETSISDLSQAAQDYVTELALLEDQLQSILELSDQENLFTEALLGGRGTIEDKIIELQEALRKSQDAVAEIEARQRVNRDNPTELNALAQQLAFQKQLQQQIINNTGALRGYLNLSDDQLENLKDLRQALIDRAAIENNANLSEKEKTEQLEKQDKVLDSIIEKRRKEAETIDALKKAEKRRSKEAEEFDKTVEKIEKQAKLRGKSSSEREIIRLQELLDQARESIVSDGLTENPEDISFVENSERIIRENEERIQRLRDDLANLRTRPDLSEEEKNKRAGDITADIAAAEAENKKEARLIQERKDAVLKGEKAIQAEIAELQKDKQEKEKEAAKQRDLAYKKLLLQQAKNNENLEEELKLTEQIRKIEMEREAERLFGAKDPQKRAEFEKVQEAQLQFELNQLREKGLEDQKKIEKDREEALKKAEKIENDRVKRQEKIRDALLDQVKNLQQAAAVTEFLNRQDAVRLAARRRLLNFSISATKKLRKAIASGDQDKIDRARAIAGFRLDRGRELGLIEGQDPLRRAFNVNPNVAQPNPAPRNAPAANNTVTNQMLNIEDGAIEINISSNNTDEVADMIQDALIDALKGVLF